MTSYKKLVITLLEALSKTVGLDEVSSIILFGSILDGEQSPISDIDVLVVLKESDKDTIKRAVATLKRVEKSKLPSSLLELILNSVKEKTGMFKSFFVCGEEDLEKGKFHAIFSLSRVMCSLLSPSKLVLGSVLDGAKVIYGAARLPPSQNPARAQLIKSLLMNLLLSISALLIAPFTEEAAKFSMEAAKWSAMASYYYKFKKRLPVKKIPHVLDGWTYKYSLRLLRLRQQYRNDPKLLALTPIFTLKIHMLALKGVLKEV